MSKENSATSRREFLKLAGVAAPAAVAVAVTGATPAEASAPKSGSGYRRTEHVEKYLKSTRF